MTLGYNSQVLAPRPETIDFLLQFDCTHLYDPVPYVLCSDPTIKVTSFSNTEHWFEFTVIREQTLFTSALIATGLVLNPPVQAGVPSPSGVGTRNLYTSLTGSFGRIRVGAFLSTAGTNKMPDAVFFCTVLVSLSPIFEP